MSETYREFCARVYKETFDHEFIGLTAGDYTTAAITASRLNAQRKAIDKVLIEALLTFPQCIGK